MTVCNGTPLKITQGDNPTFNLTAESSGAPVDLTGAVFSTQIRGPGGFVNVFPNSQHTANPVQTGATKGKFTLALTSLNTQALMIWEGLEILTTITIGGSVVSFHGYRILTVTAAVPGLGIPNL